MELMRRFFANSLPAGVFAVAGLQLAVLLAFSGFLLWIGWDMVKVLWRFFYGIFSLFS